MLNSWYPFKNSFILVECPSKTVNVLPIASTFPGEIISRHTASSAICPLVKITVDFFFFSVRSQGYVGVKQMHCIWSCLCGFGHHCSLCWVLWLKTCVPFCPTQVFLYLGISGAHTHFTCFFFSWGHVSFWNVIVASSGPRSWCLVQSSTVSVCFIRSLSIHLLLVIWNTTQYEHHSDFQ